MADHLAGIVVPGASGNYLYTRQSWKQAGGYPEFAGALDAWGFGLRQVATGQRMMVMETGHYQHRHGHESYWTREAAKNQTALLALQLLVPYLDQLHDEDVAFITSRQGRQAWHGALDHHPIRLADGSTGKAGVILDANRQLIPFFANLYPEQAPTSTANQVLQQVFELARQGQLGEQDYTNVMQVLTSSGNHEMIAALQSAWDQGSRRN